MITQPLLRSFLATLAIAALALISAGGHAGQVYKWTDEAGQVHYSDKKPNNVDSKSLKVKGGKQTQDRTDPKEKSQALDESKQEQLEKKAEELQAKNKQQEKDSRCEAIRNNLKTIEENSRVRIEENGQLRYLTEEEITNKKAQFQKQLSEFCQ